MSGNKIRVLIADDHSLVRKSLRHLLEKEQDIEVVGTAADGKEAIQLAVSLAPDVVVMDIAMPQVDGIRATEQILIQNQTQRVVILSMYASSALVRKALDIGASGYVLKRTASEELLEAIRAAQVGSVFLSPQIAAS